jgi:phosphoribosylaminoimidazolecarboxamide formyltransferase/IMP cyclohydrolase
MRDIKRALISVSDKSYIVALVQKLHQLGIEIVSTGGTADLLKQSHIPLTEISDYTGYPEIMNGRVKTLHPKVHGGLLGRRGIDHETMNENEILDIDLLIVNLYPFQKTIEMPACSFEKAIENIDIGGPAMLRAAAKNYHDITVVTDPCDYDKITQELNQYNRHISPETRFKLACKAFSYTAEYDTAITSYLNQYAEKDNLSSDSHTPPEHLLLNCPKIQTLRYGENPHQNGALYRDNNHQGASLVKATQKQGKPMSYNNYADTDAALETVFCAIVKHANPCGVAETDNIVTAYEQAFKCDPTSAFGGIIAVNRTIDTELARKIIDNQFVEVLIAPGITDKATQLTSKRPNMRILILNNTERPAQSIELKKIHGGFLYQDKDLLELKSDTLQFVTYEKPSPSMLSELQFAWKVVKMVKSNAIVYAKQHSTIGIGAGQMSRVDSSRIAIDKGQYAGVSFSGAVMASDAFFPFRDALDHAADHGISAIIQPGGSIHDPAIIEAANERNITMVLTGIRHFKH